MDNPRERILQRLRVALQTKNPIPYPEVEQMDGIFGDAPNDLDILFVEQFQKLGGQFIYCEDTNAVMTNLAQLRQQKKMENNSLSRAFIKTIDGAVRYEVFSK